MERKKNKQAKLHLKVGDKVKVIAGNEKGKTGRVINVFTQKKRAIVEDLNIVYKHKKPSADNPQGEIVQEEASIHISNLMVIDPSTGEAKRTGRKRNEEGRLERYFKEHTSHTKS